MDNIEIDTTCCICLEKDKDGMDGNEEYSFCFNKHNTFLCDECYDKCFTKIEEPYSYIRHKSTGKKVMMRTFQCPICRGGSDDMGAAECVINVNGEWIGVADKDCKWMDR